jgi:hypothetical protein
MRQSEYPDMRAPHITLLGQVPTCDGRRFRIIGIVGVPDDVGIYNALWKVESVSD